MEMAGKWLAFEEEAWIFNWTGIKQDFEATKEQGPSIEREGWKGYISSEDGHRDTSHSGHNPLVECVLLSVFGTLVGLFVIFQLVLYIRFCITGHHDWKWSLPYILRMRRIDCGQLQRRRQNRERQDQESPPHPATETKKVPEESEKGLPEKRWSMSSRSSSENTMWAHMYPGGAGGVLPCRPGFFFTTRSLGSYFRALANTVSSSRSASRNNVTPPRGEPNPLPAAAVLLVGQETNPPISLTPSVNAKSACHSKWRQKNEAMLGIRQSLRQKGHHSEVLFHCENPGYESDASLGLTPTDDEEMTDAAEASEEVTPELEVPVDPVPETNSDPSADRLSDDSFTSISSLSGTSGRISRSLSHGSLRYNSLKFIKDKPGIYIRNRPSSTASEHKSRRLRARASSRCNSDASDFKRFAPIKPNNKFILSMSRNDLNKLGASLDKSKKDRKCRMRQALELNDELYPSKVSKGDLRKAIINTDSQKGVTGRNITGGSQENNHLPGKASPDEN